MFPGEVGKSARLTTSQLREALECFVGLDIQAVSQIGVAVENALHVGGFGPCSQDVAKEVGRGLRLVGEWLAESLGEDLREFVVGLCLVPEAIGLAGMPSGI